MIIFPGYFPDYLLSGSKILGDGNHAQISFRSLTNIPFFFKSEYFLPKIRRPGQTPYPYINSTPTPCFLFHHNYRFHLSATVPSPLTIFRNSYSLVNSRLNTSKSPTSCLQQLTRASLGVIAPSVCTRSSIFAKRG